MEQNEAKKTILLIDDDTSLLVTLSDFLRFEGYEVVTADSGEQGLKRLAGLDPDLIILDMSMPGMGGVGFLKEISSSTGKPRHPVLVLTARANMAEFFANVDVDGFVAKPCNPNDLLMEVSRIVFLRSGGDDTGAEKSSAKRKILLGEDDEGIRDDLTSFFASKGYVVDSAPTGPETLEKAIVQRPDLVLVKLTFANMNGDTVAEMLKQIPNTKKIPIVLYDDAQTGAPESKYTESGTEIRRFIASNDAGELEEAVEGVLGG